jgi:hypothetical protein
MPRRRGHDHVGEQDVNWHTAFDNIQGALRVLGSMAGREMESISAL